MVDTMRKEKQGKNSNTETKPSTAELEDDESGKDRTRCWCINGGDEAQKNAERRRRSEDAEACGEKKTDVDGSNGCSGRSEQREGGSVRRLAAARFDTDAEKATRDEHASEIYRRVEVRDSACRRDKDGDRQVEAKCQCNRESPFDFGRKLNFLKTTLSILYNAPFSPSKLRISISPPSLLNPSPSLFCNLPPLSPFTFQHRRNVPCTASFILSRTASSSGKFTWTTGFGVPVNCFQLHATV
ncbi:hypothetical protein LR48_Vigan05g018200 [Vigna angularis]|uniref:Uncharacterized protein n=1 Tax=Phaseolus angularis TaxID=3914 RepID=A0A0L9UIK1_PHAAN|nr:hypothetical protein LR48_Vigan05g018200 [Vigna angularis]